MSDSLDSAKALFEETRAKPYHTISPEEAVGDILMIQAYLLTSIAESLEYFVDKEREKLYQEGY